MGGIIRGREWMCYCTVLNVVWCHRNIFDQSIWCTKFLITYKEETLSQRKKEKRRKRKAEVESDVMDPLEYYEAVKLQKKRKKEAKEAAFR